MLVATLVLSGPWGLAVSVVMAQGVQEFRARLEPVAATGTAQPRPPTAGYVNAALDGHSLYVTGRFAGFFGGVDRATINLSKQDGERGKAVYSLQITGDAGGEISGTVNLNRKDLDALHSGRLYIHMRGSRAPAVELMGWLLPAGMANEQ